MTLEKCIAQLKDLRQDREDFLDGEFMDDPYAADIEAIDTALAAIDDLLKARKLLKSATNVLNMFIPCDEDNNCSECIKQRQNCDYDDSFKWRYTDEALKLIGEDETDE